MLIKIRDGNNNSDVRYHRQLNPDAHYILVWSTGIIPVRRPHSMKVIYPMLNSENILVCNAIKASNIGEMKAKMKVDALHRYSSQRQAPMTPTPGSIPKISGNISSKLCHRSLVETSRELKCLNPI